MKIIILVLFILCINLLANSIALSIITRTNNKLLYQAISNNLTISANTISKKLQNIQTMTDIIIGDDRIQTNLSIAAESNDNAKRNNAYQSLSFLTPEYYTNYKSNNIKYINLYNKNYVLYSNIALSNKTPDSLHSQLLAKSAEKSGYPVWIDSYGNEYGLFLVRDVRKAENLELTTIGTIVVNIDLDTLVNTSVNTDMFTEPAKFIITRNDDEIYHSKTFDNFSRSEIDQKLHGNYGIIYLNAVEYFYVRGIIPKYSWDYVCFVPYHKISLVNALAVWSAISVNVAAIILIFLIARIVINSITIHYNKLVEKMISFGKSHTFVPDNSYDYSSRKDEIGELHRNFDLMADEHQNLVKRYYEQEILARDSKVKALENQVNPHFLYNTLEAINCRAKALEQKDISLMIESLGSLFRNVLNSDGDYIHSSLEHEISIVNNYLDIMRFRFGDRIQFAISIDKRLNSILLPHISLQPLVENAVNCALEDILEVCRIDISAFIENNNLSIIQVMNNGSQFEDNLLYKLEHKQITPRGTGIGILNIHQRIQLSYGEEYGLHFFNPDDDHAVVQMRIPYRENSHD